MEQGNVKLSVREKIGYSFGDGAANFVFQTMLIFQLGFYTDVFGITAAAAGTLLLVGRFWDALFDPFMGVIADRTNTRWGKFRPWVLWSAVPFAVVFALKAGLGLGGAICGWLLAAYGYEANAVQTEHALFGIRMTASIYPAITFFIGVVALGFYGITKKLNVQIQDELAERRKAFTVS